MKEIRFYRVNDPYGCFSNFSSHGIFLDGTTWPTTEHYFQAQKFLDGKHRLAIQLAKSPMEAAAMGRDRTSPLRADWERIKDDVMRNAVRAKVMQHAAVRAALLSTGDAVLIEHTRNDSYWADGGNGSGRNMLGIILMEVRAELLKDGPFDKMNAPLPPPWGQELIEKFRAKPWPPSAFEELAKQLQSAAPAEIDAFALAALAALPNGGTFFDTVLSHVSEPAFDQLVARAVEMLGQPERGEACESVIAYASLQQPQALAPHLPRLFELRPNDGAYYENWYWRGAGESGIAFLRGMIESGADKRRAWECLLETRQKPAITLARETASRVGGDPSAAASLRIIANARLEPPLYSQSCAHLAFAPGYFARPRPVWLSRGLHPTWNLPGTGPELRFGGLGSTSCGLCGGRLHHLVTLPEEHAFGSRSENSVSLEVCLSCLGWEQHLLCYTHSDDGRPQSLDQGACMPQFPALPLQETRVRLAKTPARWQSQDWALANGRENLNRLGGPPCWIQSDDYPQCPTCGKSMRFMLQLDSDLPTAEGDDWLWGSGGICYAFQCGPCRNTAYLWQCT